MADKTKILCVGDPCVHDEELIARLRDDYEIDIVESPLLAVDQLAGDHPYDGIYLVSEHLTEGLRLGNLLRNERILEGMPDGMALLNSDNVIVWANEKLRSWFPDKKCAGNDLYDVFGKLEVEGPDGRPFRNAVSTGHASCSKLRCADNRHFQVHSVPVVTAADPEKRHLIVTVRDVTTEMLQQQKLAAIHQAGVELADLTTEEVFHMRVEERIELLKSNILHYTQDLLNFDVVEIRLLAQETQQLVPLLSVGIEEVAAHRPLSAHLEGQGVTGYVAATGKSYLCEDTVKDPLYLEGCKDAKSSLTVPLIQHDQVIGTFNVESPEPRAFTENDMQFLEIFSRDVARALNTLELLVAQQANTAQASVEAIHREVALPVDEILNDAVNVMEKYIGHHPAVVKRLQRILRNARDIKQVIHKVGQELAPAEAVPQSVQAATRPLLAGRRVLVVDQDDTVRGAAHNLLERYGCVVETSHNGDQAISMVRNVGIDAGYDVIISDIKLPDMSGYDLLVKLKQDMDRIRLVLMTGFGYDPGHTIVKARQAGLMAGAVLYKPFRLDQLLEVVEGVIEAVDEAHTA